MTCRQAANLAAYSWMDSDFSSLSDDTLLKGKGHNWVPRYLYESDEEGQEIGLHTLLIARLLKSYAPVCRPSPYKDTPRNNGPKSSELRDLPYLPKTLIPNKQIQESGQCGSICVWGFRQRKWKAIDC